MGKLPSDRHGLALLTLSLLFFALFTLYVSNNRSPLTAGRINGRLLKEPSREEAVECVQVEQKPVPESKANPLLILITPTYARPTQAVHFAHVVSVLRNVPPPILWIVVENKCIGEETANLLNRTAGKCIRVNKMTECTSLNYIHLATDVFHENHTESRGVNQRNRALQFVEENRIDGVVYFMDDDNTYTPELFEEMRKVRRVGIWPVGFLWSHEFQRASEYDFFKPMVERPLVRRLSASRSVVIGWETFEWAASMGSKQRKFHSDMAGFAFRSHFLWAPKNNATGRPKYPVRFVSRASQIETMFLDALVNDTSELEPLANDCQDVNVWHTKLEAGYTDPYPESWSLPQPTSRLTRDKKESHSARYIIHKKRYHVKDYQGTIPFGYSAKG